MKEPLWTVRAPAPLEETGRIVKETGLPPLLANFVWARGLRRDVAAELEPPLVQARIPTLKLAALRLKAAIASDRRILIHGDYDADGMTGSAILARGLRELGGRVETFIPNRLTDGYGISAGRVPELAERADVLVTVDCGISNNAEVAALTERGVEVIITDHHTPGPVLPDCLVVHPRYADDAGPGTPELTGAGVAWHLLWALRSLEKLEAPFEYADLAAIGTVADVADLRGANRALVREGLKRLAESVWPGVRASLSVSRLRAPYTARQLAFVIAPRLNASGRLGEADLGLELLMTASETRARELAVYLDARNEQRRQIQDEMYARLEGTVNPADPALVVHDPEGHPGVMGIVASKLLERFYRPVFIIADGKGSVRSTPGISAVAALEAAAPHLRGYGGHTLAAGFSLDEADIPAFTQAIHGFAGGHPEPRPHLVVDHVLAGDDASRALLGELDKLEPFGEGLEAPLFGLFGQLEQARAVGRDARTLQLRVAGMKGVWWGNGQRAEQLRAGRNVHAAVSLTEAEFRGVKAVEFRVSGLRDAAELELADDAAAPEVEPLPATVVRGAPTGPGRRLERLPLPVDPLDPPVEFMQLLQEEQLLFLDFGPEALAEIEERIRLLPDLHDSRRAWVYLSRGTPLPWPAERQELLRRVLRELDLVDARGLPRRGVKRDPWTSDTLYRAELERFRLQTFLNACRHYGDAAFSMVLARLFGTPDGSGST